MSRCPILRRMDSASSIRRACRYSRIRTSASGCIDHYTNVMIQRWKRTFYERIAGEVSAMTRYYDAVIQFDPPPSDTGYLLECVDAPQKSVADSIDLRSERERRTAVLLNGNLNRELNIQDLLMRIRAGMSRTSRVVVVSYNPYLALLYRLTTWLGLRAAESNMTFVTLTDLRNLARLSG